MSCPLLCAVCPEHQPSKYSCPHCAIRTCSLVCSRAHKAQTGCSGVRERTSYVPLNKYGYTEFMNDYVFLEDVGRQVDHWGREILRGGYASVSPAGRPAENALRGTSMRAHGKSRPKMRARQQEKRSFLAMQLSLRDVHMDVLPAGMENAKRNRSHWDSRKRSAFFTIEFFFHPPSDPVAQQEAKPLSLLTHKNDWETPIWQLVRSSIKATGKHKNDVIVDWLGLGEVDDGTVPSSALCVMKRPKLPDDPPQMKLGRPYYYKLDWGLALSAALRRKHFVEFPSILISDESLIDGILVRDEGIEDLPSKRLSKNRKLDPVTAKRTLAGLVGAYRSDDEDRSAQATNLLHILDDYSGDSNNEGAVLDAEERGDIEEMEDTQEGVDSEEEALDARDILDKAGVEAENGDSAGEDDDDNDMVGWGDDEIAEDEAKLASLTATFERRHSEE